MKQKPDQYEDDGRVICDMNVDGMPWHTRRANQAEVKKPKSSQVEMTYHEAFSFTSSALLAALLVVGVFSLTWVLFILFCTRVWFR